jgi:hypothetical protein
MEKKVIIYKISNSVNNDLYVGSTTQSLKQRFTKHISRTKNEKYKNIKLHKIMNEIGIDKFKIELLEETEFINKEEQLKLENKYIKELKPVLNSQLASDKCLEHNKIKCSICKTSKTYCEHNKRKSQCVICKGGSICKHNRNKYHCKECKGSGICKHNKNKHYCKECNNFICEICNVKFSGNNSLNQHYKSKKHINNLKIKK